MNKEWIYLLLIYPKDMSVKNPFEYNQEDAKIYIPICVNDFQVAKDFYVSILGFQVVFDEAESMGWLELSSPSKDVRIGLDLRDELFINSKIPVMCLSVNNIKEVQQYLEKSQVKVSKIRNIPQMVALLDCWDPFGNIIQFMAPPL